MNWKWPFGITGFSTCVLVGICTLAGANAHARPEFWATFERTYAVKKGSALEQAKCITCHIPAGPPARNPYGKTVEEALHAAHSKEVTSTILRQIENKDSDGDGWTNGDEIAAGTLPGDPKSHPSGTPVKHPSSGATPGPATSGPAPLIPTHSFHPQIVHFPIALFLFGGFLEGWGLWKRRSNLREAGFLCMTGAGVTSLAAVATGLIAVYRLGFALKGTVLIHLVLALSATVGMAVTALAGRAAARAGKERSGRLYWLILLLSLALVGAAGHFGGMLVYG